MLEARGCDVFIAVHDLQGRSGMRSQRTNVGQRVQMIEQNEKEWSLSQAMSADDLSG